MPWSGPILFLSQADSGLLKTISPKTFAEFFNVTLVLDETVLEDVSSFYKRGRELTEINRQQAFVPEGC